MSACSRSFGFFFRQWFTKSLKSSEYVPEKEGEKGGEAEDEEGGEAVNSMHLFYDVYSLPPPLHTYTHATTHADTHSRLPLYHGPEYSSRTSTTHVHSHQPMYARLLLTVVW